VWRWARSEVRLRGQIGAHLFSRGRCADDIKAFRERTISLGSGRLLFFKPFSWRHAATLADLAANVYASTVLWSVARTSTPFSDNPRARWTFMAKMASEIRSAHPCAVFADSTPVAQ
jgi:hypothetical protein